MEYEKGDLVEAWLWNIHLRRRVLVQGVILGTPGDWWVIAGHYDVRGHIIPEQEMHRIVTKQFVKSGEVYYFTRYCG